MKLYIGNKAYSSWSLRGWLACRQSGLPFEEAVVPLYDEAWEKRREGDEFAPSSGKVPILWDGDAVVWDSLAIIEYLNDKTGNTSFWPKDPAARAMARSMAAEMHSSFAALRRKHSMNVRKVYPPKAPDADVLEDIGRIMELWAQARARYGGEGQDIRILNGGSVKGDNAAELLSASEVGGALVGGASLTADGFVPIIAAAASLDEQ